MVLMMIGLVVAGLLLLAALIGLIVGLRQRIQRKEIAGVNGVE